MAHPISQKRFDELTKKVLALAADLKVAHGVAEKYRAGAEDAEFWKKEMENAEAELRRVRVRNSARDQTIVQLALRLAEYGDPKSAAG